MTKPAPSCTQNDVPRTVEVTSQSARVGAPRRTQVPRQELQLVSRAPIFLITASCRCRITMKWSGFGSRSWRRCARSVSCLLAGEDCWTRQASTQLLSSSLQREKTSSTRRSKGQSTDVKHARPSSASDATSDLMSSGRHTSGVVGVQLRSGGGSGAGMLESHGDDCIAAAIGLVGGARPGWTRSPNPRRRIR